MKVAARRQLRRRMGSRRGCGRFRRGGQRCGGQWCRWRHESWSRDGALHRVTLLRPGGARRPAQEPGREDLGEAVAGSTPTCPPVVRRTAKRCLGASARPSGRRTCSLTCSSSPRTTSTTLASRYERRAVERQRARWHDPVLRRWLGLTPKRPALCLRGLQKVIARECSEEMIFCRACGKCRRVAAAYGIADKG